MAKQKQQSQTVTGTDQTPQASYHAKFVTRKDVPFKNIILADSNWSRPDDNATVNPAKDKAMAKSFVDVGGFDRAFPAVVEEIDGGKYVLLGGNRRFRICTALVAESKLPANLTWYVDVYKNLTDDERIAANFEDNAELIAKARATDVQTFIATWNAWSKKVIKMEKGREVLSAPEDGATALSRVIGISYGTAQGIYPVISIGKLMPELKILERVQNSLAEKPASDALWVSTMQQKKADTNTLRHQIIEARKLTSPARENALEKYGKAFNALFAIREDSNRKKMMSGDNIDAKISGHVNPFVKVTGNGIKIDDMTVIDAISPEQNALCVEIFDLTDEQCVKAREYIVKNIKKGKSISAKLVPQKS